MKIRPTWAAVLLAAVVAIPAAAADWSFGLAAGPGRGALSDNTGRIPADDVKIPELYPRTGGIALAFTAERHTSPDLNLGLEWWQWSSDEILAPDQMHAAVTVSWLPAPWLDLRFGVGGALARVRYLEQGISETIHDFGTAFVGSAGLRSSFGDRWVAEPRIQWNGFATTETEVWANTVSMMIVLSREPEEIP